MGLELYKKNIIMSKEADIYTILNLLERITVEHTELYDIGFESMIKQHKLWFLLKMKYDILFEWEEGQTLFLSTWPGKRRHFEFPRHYTLTDETGKIYLKATSVWGIISLDTRKMITEDIQSPFEILLDTPYPNRLKKIMPLDPSFESFKGEYMVEDSDLDGNKHMNNKQYAIMMKEVLSITEASSFEINYNHEAKLNDKIQLHIHQNDDKIQVDGFLFGSESCFSAWIYLKR